MVSFFWVNFVVAACYCFWIEGSRWCWYASYFTVMRELNIIESDVMHNSSPDHSFRKTSISQ